MRTNEKKNVKKKNVNTCIEERIHDLLTKWHVSVAQCIEIGFFVCEEIRKTPQKKEVNPKLFVTDLYERAHSYDDVKEWISRVKGNSLWAEFKGWRSVLEEQRRLTRMQQAFDEHREGDVK
jgi:hypothetical protein